ncbi:hypothetical protein CEP52_000072 [Fusarium oligoseptatum]|uniref:Prion-inhibition and propagation HeLo domain-containing protein n=1 Tax=Fusarium oligoseptatum TaxID=2604345 RepID=A0A428UQN9_9HYPO|nr:hypothetical protein CEP52_000072 [Fusarium oligoseptatum]
MAEAVGTALGVVGVLGQLFAGCVQAYGFFTTAANLDTDSQRLLCKVRIEEMRLVVWGRDWGVAEGRLEAHLESTRNPQLRSLALQILGELHSAVTDFNKLKERYGLVDEGKSASLEVKGGKGKKSPSPSRNGSRDDEGRKSNGLAKTLSASSERSWGKEFGLRAKWVIGDKEKVYKPTQGLTRLQRRS